MFAQIIGNLRRQAKGLELLESLQSEEYELLSARDSAAVSSLEFSIHELLRQIAIEREDMRTVMQGTTLLEYAGMLPEEEGKEVRMFVGVIDTQEQRCARLAERNSALSLALLDKSHELMTFLYNQLQPRQTAVYGARGNMAKFRPQAAVLNGRL